MTPGMESQTEPGQHGVSRKRRRMLKKVQMRGGALGRTRGVLSVR